MEHMGQGACRYQEDTKIAGGGDIKETQGDATEMSRRYQAISMRI